MSEHIKPNSMFRVEHRDGKTKVFNAETGEELKSICEVKFFHSIIRGREDLSLEVTQRDFAPIVDIGDVPANCALVDDTSLTDSCRKYKPQQLDDFGNPI